MNSAASEEDSVSDARDRKLAVLFGVLVVLSGSASAATSVSAPYSARQQAAEALEFEIEDKKLRLAKVEKDRPRLLATMKRSLPADVNDSRHAYEAAITPSSATPGPRGASTVKSKPVDGKVTPRSGRRSRPLLASASRSRSSRWTTPR